MGNKIELHNLLKRSYVKRKKRVGRGLGSGHGKTCARGQKGQKSRSGGAKPIYFEGGQMPLIRRIPKLKGFKNINRIDYIPVNVEKLNVFNDGDVIDLEKLASLKIIGKKEKYVKLLGSGNLNKKLVIKGLKCSQLAKEKILAAGGTIN